MPQGLPRKLRNAFLRQALLGSAAIVVGIAVVCVLVTTYMSNERLRLEAEAYRAAHAADPSHPLPRSSRMSMWFVPGDRSDPRAGSWPPAEIGALPVGISVLPDNRRVLVEDDADGRLYLAMSFELPDRVATVVGVAAAVLALLVFHLVSWRTYRSSRRMVLPVNRLAQEVTRWDPGDIDSQALEPFLADTSDEVTRLVSALHGLGTRTSEFVQRERNFTRDASHELRTPLTVIRMAGDMLLGDASIPPHAQRSLQRIVRAGQDMEALVDAFLILAREQGVAPISEEFDVRAIVEEEVEKIRPQLAGRPIELRVLSNADPRLNAPPRVLEVMLGNLLQNAVSFTESGSIDVVIDADRVVVRDTGIGMSQEVLEHVYEPFFRADQFRPMGKGIGLNIVSRLGDRFGWPVSHESTPGEGTSAIIRFAGALSH